MITFLQNSLSFFWLALAILFAVIEGLTMGLTTIWFTLGALITIPLALFKIPFWWQVLLFLLISLGLLIFTRPVAIKKFKVGNIKTNSEELIEKIGTVTTAIPPLDKGLVKVGGQIWTAASEDGSVIPQGALVRIKKIEGVTLYVQLEEK
jgi:membrane protein implicated in regulation of membrane protease activity